MKQAALLAVLVVAVIASGIPALAAFGLEALSAPDPVIAGMISRVSEPEIYDTVYRLQNFTTRDYGSQGNVDAGTYLFDYLDHISGLIVEYQGGSLRNIIATLPGEDAADSFFMIGAHYDSTSSDPDFAPGATDNGGGVAIVLEFARIMSQYRFKRTIKFAFWNNEEAPMAASGAYDYAGHARDSNLNISLYMNFDSSCYDPNNRFILDIMYNDESQWISELMTQRNSLYDIGFTLTYNAHTCGSDHRSFWAFDYTAIMTHEETHGPAHSASDTVDKVNTLYAKKNGQLGMSVIAELAELQSTEIFGIDVVSPRNETYATSSVELSFTVDEPTSWMGYSLDGQTNITITGNTTLADIADGTHSLVVYANDTAGEMARSDTICFTVDTVPPEIDVVSPRNETYATSSVELSFTVDEPTSWMGYSLDGGANRTISKLTQTVPTSVNLWDLPDGSHDLIVFANDTAGNLGSSEEIHFIVSAEQTMLLSPVLGLVLGSAIVIGLCAAAVFIVYQINRKAR